jgi:hypothetical protein
MGTRAYPHFALPGPQIGFLQEILRWWDYWLKGIDTGVMDEPMLRAWMTDNVKPATHHDTLPGRWKIFDRCVARHRHAIACGRWADDATSRRVRPVPDT